MVFIKVHGVHKRSFIDQLNTFFWWQLWYCLASISTEETCLQYFLVILKHPLHNYEKILKTFDWYYMHSDDFSRFKSETTQNHTIVCYTSLSHFEIQNSSSWKSRVCLKRLPDWLVGANSFPISDRCSRGGV